jgi:hypothetical protein
MPIRFAAMLAPEAHQVVTLLHHSKPSLASTYNPAFVMASGGSVPSAEALLVAGLFAGQAYLNIHDVPNFGGGEIRGFLVRVREPASLIFLGVSVLAMAAASRRRHR